MMRYDIHAVAAMVAVAAVAAVAATRERRRDPCWTGWANAVDSTVVC